MNRPIRVLLISLASAAAAATVAACGSEKIAVRKSDPTYQGAVLFSQRCSGCHTLNFAATHGSAPNVRTREAINGPNFNVRCERPVTRVLYAIENGGFSGGYMPQNIVVGHQADEVAQFVSKYAGRQAVYQPGSSTPPCKQQQIGTLPPTTTPSSTPSPNPTATTASASAATPVSATSTAPAKTKTKAKAHKGKTGRAQNRKK